MNKLTVFIISLIILLTMFTDSLFSSQYKGDRFWSMRPPSARTAGMGRAPVGIVENAHTVFWNPGGISFLNGFNFSYSYDPYTSAISEGKSEIQSVSFNTQLKNSFTIGLNVRHFNFYSQDQNHIALSQSFDSGISFGYRKNNLGFGINAKFLSSAQGYIKTKSLPSAVDIGALYSKKYVFKNIHPLNINFGISLLNISKGITYELWNSVYKEYLPVNLRVGYAAAIQLRQKARKSTPLAITHNFEYSYILNADRNYNLPYKSLGFGFESVIFEILSLRIGYFYQKGGREPLNDDVLYNGITYGFGVNIPIYHLYKSIPLSIMYDYAQFPWDPNSISKKYHYYKIHSVSLKFAF